MLRRSSWLTFLSLVRGECEYLVWEKFFGWILMVVTHGIAFRVSWSTPPPAGCRRPSVEVEPSGNLHSRRYQTWKQSNVCFCSTCLGPEASMLTIPLCCPALQGNVYFRKAVVLARASIITKSSGVHIQNRLTKLTGFLWSKIINLETINPALHTRCCKNTHFCARM